MRLAYLLRSIALASLLTTFACDSKPLMTPASGGRGGTSGSSGGGGESGADGGMPITSCPPLSPSLPLACTGAFTCEYFTDCGCNGCCGFIFACSEGRFEQQSIDNSCLPMPPCDAGPPPVCVFGADQTCNDNPALSSIHGHCTDAGTCACADAGTNPDSGRCL